MNSAEAAAAATAVGSSLTAAFLGGGGQQQQPRRNTGGEDERSEDNSMAVGSSGGRPRGSSSGSAISTTPKKAGGILSGLRNPMVNQVIRASSDGDGSSNRDGSSEGGGSPADENELRTRLIAKIEGAKQRIFQINLEKEKDLSEFISMADRVEAGGGRNTPHMARIQQHYEKKNKKSAGQIDVVQKKLAAYEARLIDLDNGGSGAADPARGHMVLAGIRQAGANLRNMTSTVVSAPLELAQKLKRGTMGSSSDPMEGDFGHSQFYSAVSSRSASGLASTSGGGPSTSTATSSGAAKQKASTLPANMRMSPVDLEAAAAATGFSSNLTTGAAAVPSTSGSAASSIDRPPQRRKVILPDEESSSKGAAAAAAPAADAAEDSLARMPQLGALLQQEREAAAAAAAAAGGGERRRGSNNSDTVPFVMVPRAQLSTGQSVYASEDVAALVAEIAQLRQQNKTIVQHMDQLQENVQQEMAKKEKLMAEERFKFTRLETSLNDFIEFHQSESGSLKAEIQTLGARVLYQYNDRFKKMEENLESTQNHMFRVENSMRSHIELQEAAGGGRFNVVFLSGATILLELLKIGLYLMAVVLDFFRPFTGTRTKAGFFLLILFTAFFLVQNAGWIIGLFGGGGGSAASNVSSASLSNATHSAAAAAAAAGQAPPPPPPTLPPPSS